MNFDLEFDFEGNEIGLTKINCRRMANIIATANTGTTNVIAFVDFST